MMGKVLVLGLDGGTWDLIKPWADAGELPTFKRLMENGAWGILESTFPPITVPAWPSMLTGKKPEKLGVYYFTRRDPETYEPRINRQVFDRPIWQILHNQGKQCYVINVPWAELPREDETSGVFIAGPMAHIGDLTNQPRIRTLIEETGYQVGNPSRRLFEEGQHEHYLTEMISREKKQFALVKKLLHESWDLLFYVNFFTDGISHRYWKYLDETHPDHEENEQIKSLIKSFYKEIDRFLDLLAGNASNLFVVSDHGFGPLYGDINLNSWLAQEGLLRRRAKAKRGSPLPKLKPSRLLRLTEWMAGMVGKSFNLLIYKPFRASFEARRRKVASGEMLERGLIARIIGKDGFARKALRENPAYLLTVGWLVGAGFVLIGLPSWRLLTFLNRRLHARHSQKKKEEEEKEKEKEKEKYRKALIEQAPVLEHIDWRRTRAYSTYYAGINVNLRHRERLGRVAPSKYEHVREEIIKRALQIRDKEGRQVVEGAYRAEEIYDNPSPISFPDIVLKYKDMKYQNRPQINLGLSTEIFTKWEDSGGHKSEGIFLAYGSEVKRGYRVDSAKIHDLVPTILHIFGLPIPKDIDGRVLKEIFEEGSELARREVTHQKSEAVDEKERLREKTKEKIRELKASRRI